MDIHLSLDRSLKSSVKSDEFSSMFSKSSSGSGGDGVYVYDVCACASSFDTQSSFLIASGETRSPEAIENIPSFPHMMVSCDVNQKTV